MALITREFMETLVANLPFSQPFNLMCEHKQPLHVGVIFICR